MAGDILMALCHYLKGKVTIGNAENYTCPPAECVGKFMDSYCTSLRTPTLKNTLSLFRASTGCCRFASVGAAGCLQPTGENYSGISLSEGICWPWQRMKHRFVRLLLWIERWEQTRCLIHAEVSALEGWNAKAKLSPLKKISIHAFSLPSCFFSSLTILPSQEWCHFRYSCGKVLSALVSKCWEISASLSK